jgi:hypothetical protein
MLSDLFFGEICLTKFKVFTFLRRNLYGDVKFQNSEYEVHQVGFKNSGSRNFSFLAAEGAELASTQNFSTTATETATARSNHVSYS